MQNYNYVPYTAVVSNVKESWSQGHYVEQHSRAELQLRTIYSSCVQCKRELVTRTLRRAALTCRTTATYHIKQWASRRGEGEPNPPRETKNSGANGGRNWRTEVYVQNKIKRKKLPARKKRRRGRTRRRAARRQACSNRDRAHRRELVIAIHNVRTMAVDGKHGVGRAAEVLDVYEEMGCDIIGLQETRRRGQSTLLQAGYVVYCSGESGGEEGGKKGQGGVGLAVRKSISVPKHDRRN